MARHRGPLVPIFDPDKRRGNVLHGHQIGQIVTRARPSTLTLPISIPTPTVTTETVDYADDFNRADNGDINAGAPMSWTDNGNINITSNTLHFNGGFDSQVQINAAIAYSNQWCEVDVVGNPNEANMGLIVRGTLASGNNQYSFRYMGNVPGHPTPDQWELYKKVGGAYTLLASQAETEPSTPFRIRMEVDGTSVRGYQVVAGTKVLKCTGTLDGAITGKNMAIWVQHYGISDAIVDNFEAGPL